MLVAVFVTLSVALAEVAAGPAPVPQPAYLKLDALYARRDDPRALEDARRVADAGVAASPADYGTLWRAARAYFSLSDDPKRPDDARERAGKTAWDLAQRAVAVNPEGVEGHYWAALGVGGWAREMGVVRAIANGIEGKFTGELRRAETLDPGYDHGNIPVVWAAYYLDVPWPKRDRKKAAEYLRRALQKNPASLRARLYLAQIAKDEGRPTEAKALLAEIASAPVGRYDAPEERRVKEEALTLASAIK